MNMVDMNDVKLLYQQIQTTKVLLTILEKQDESILLLSGFILIGFVGFVDFLTGYEYSLSAFYVLPIALITWGSSQNLGFVVSFVSAIVWFIAEAASGQPHSHHFAPLWNTLIRSILFCTIVALLTKIKILMQRERELARTDYLTSAVNSRCFREIAQMEMLRIQRHHRSFTIAYLDLDNFKLMNDQFGHFAGDQALQTVVHSIKKRIRRTDTIARLGGDEFVLFFPETDDKAAHLLMADLHHSLSKEMQINSWPITFSIGVLTCQVAPNSVDELVAMADDLMYSAKFTNKNAIKYSTYP
jgi:diguanylate cyclase (GGDEF)-like protein